MIAEIHVAPDPAGTEEQQYVHIEAAIGVVVASGLTYSVGALGTTFEGSPDEVWQTLRAAHAACLASGAERVITSIRIADWSDGTVTIDDLTGGYR